MSFKDSLIVYITGTQEEINQYLKKDLVIENPLRMRELFLMFVGECGFLVGHGLASSIYYFKIFDPLVSYSVLADILVRTTGSVIQVARYDRAKRIIGHEEEVLDNLASTAENTILAPGLVGRVRQLFKNKRSTPIDKSHDFN